eukprot:scaffold52681_cov69-Phaeocystis_antarctica.AAC.12
MSTSDRPPLSLSVWSSRSRDEDAAQTTWRPCETVLGVHAPVGEVAAAASGISAAQRGRRYSGGCRCGQRQSAMHKASASIHKRGSVLRSVPLRLRDTTVHGAVHGTMKGARWRGRKKFGVQTADRFVASKRGPRASFARGIQWLKYGLASQLVFHAAECESDRRRLRLTRHEESIQQPEAVRSRHGDAATQPPLPGLASRVATVRRHVRPRACRDGLRECAHALRGDAAVV